MLTEVACKIVDRTKPIVQRNIDRSPPECKFLELPADCHSILAEEACIAGMLLWDPRIAVAGESVAREMLPGLA